MTENPICKNIWRLVSSENWLDLANFPWTVRRWVISMSHPFQTTRYLHPKIFINITSPCLHKFYGFFKKIFKFASLLSKYFQLAYVITRWVILTYAVLFSHQTNSGEWREWMIVTHLESTLVWKYKKNRKKSFVSFEKP